VNQSAGVAQLVEQRIRNAKVGSSILLTGTKHIRPTVLSWAFSFVDCQGFAGRAAILRGPRGCGWLPVLPPVRLSTAHFSLKTITN
jgi:hypothetical protein